MHIFYLSPLIKLRPNSCSSFYVTWFLVITSCSELLFIFFYHISLDTTQLTKHSVVRHTIVGNTVVAHCTPTVLNVKPGQKITKFRIEFLHRRRYKRWYTQVLYSATTSGAEKVITAMFFESKFFFFCFSAKAKQVNKVK